MLDRLQPEYRHLVIILFPMLIAWATQEIPSWNLPLWASGLVGVLVTGLGLWFTKITEQYGRGASTKEAPDEQG